MPAREFRVLSRPFLEKGRGGCVCAHGCRLTGKMTGAGLRSVAWASVITLDSTSVVTLGDARHGHFCVT